MRIVGVLLILLGLVLFVSPQVRYSSKENIARTGSLEITAKRQKVIEIPRPVSLLIVGAGVMLIVFASRKSQ
jgi:hypothetical protein